MQKGLIVAMGLLVCIAAGCGGGNDAEQDAGGLASVTPTPTATASPSVTRTPHTPGGHSEILVGSSEAGGGALRFAPDFDGRVEVPFDQCLGGSGDECTGGTLLFEATSPGFEALASSAPGEGVFALPTDTLVRLVLVFAPPSTKLRFSNTVLDQTGESAVLGFVPFHADVQWQIAIPGGETVPEHIDVVVRLLTTSAAYSTSADLAIRLEPVGALHHGE